MADPDIPSVGQQTAESMAATSAYLPVLTAATAQSLPQLEQARLQAARQTSPGYAQLNEDLFRRFAPVLSQIGDNINRQSALNQAETERQVISGPGRELVQGARDTAEIYDPEYFRSRATGESTLNNLSQQANQFAGSEGISGSERAEIERSLNRDNFQRGTSQSGSQLQTVSNAIRFGEAGRNRDVQRMGALSNALSQTANLLPQLKSGVDVFQVATGRPSAPNTGQQQFTGVQKPSEQAFQQTQNLLGVTSGFTGQNTALQQQRRDVLDRTNETMSSL